MLKSSLCLIVAMVGAPVALAVDSGAIPACSVEQEAAWSQVVERQLGVSVRDAQIGRQWVGPVSNMKKASGLREQDFGGRNWFPADVFKRTACGRHKKLSVFNPLWSGRENDFHIYLQPDPGFEFLQRDVRPLGARPEFYSEITLPRGFRENRPWFWPGPRDALKSGPADSEVLSKGDGVCVYGPWVLEEYHDFQPEIHPSEAFWFRDAAEGAVHVFLAHDASDRFQLEKYYCKVSGPRVNCPQGLPPSFVAWGTPSTRHVILVPYELALDQPDRRRLKVHLHAPGGPEPKLDAIHVEHAAGRSTLEFQRYEGMPSLSISELSQRRCQAVRQGKPVVLGYVAASVVLDSDASASGPFAHLDFSGTPTTHEYPPPSPRATPGAAEPTLALHRLAYRSGESPAIADGAAGGEQVYPKGTIDVEPRARFRTAEHGRAQASFDLDISYEPAADARAVEQAEALSEYLGAILHGKRFDDDPEIEAGHAARRNRYARLFGAGAGAGDGAGCFTPSVTASLDGQSLAVSTCRKAPRVAGSEVAVCIESARSCQFLADDWLASTSPTAPTPAAESPSRRR